MKKGWTYKKLGEVCDILDSRRKPITKSKREAGNIPYYGATGLLDYVKDYIFDEKLVLLGEDGAKWGAGDKSAFIIEGKTWVNNHAHALRPKRNILIDELLVYYLNYENLQPYITGVTVPKLNQEKMRSIDVPIGPLSEQQHIVSRLDAAFADIDALKANAGKQLSEARKLFQAELTECMRPKEGWEKKALGEVGTFSRGINFSKSDFVKDGFPCIHYGQIHTTFGLVTFEHLTCIPKDIVRQDKLASKGNLIIAITSEDVEGSCKCTAWMGDYDIAIGAHAAVYKHTLNPIFVSYYFKSSIFQKEKEQYVHGFKVMEIKPSDIAKIPIAYPSKEVQHQIVTRLDALSARIKQLEEVERKTLAECDALKQAMLRDCFE